MNWRFGGGSRRSLRCLMSGGGGVLRRPGRRRAGGAGVGGRGGGQKRLSETDATLLDDLRSLVEPATRGDPQSPLLWTCKSLRKLSASLRDMGHEIGRTLGGGRLHPR